MGDEYTSTESNIDNIINGIIYNKVPRVEHTDEEFDAEGERLDSEIDFKTGTENVSVKITETKRISGVYNTINSSLLRKFNVSINGRMFCADAQIYEVGSMYGINGGRISKLRVYLPEVPRKDFIMYSRGWEPFAFATPHTPEQRAVVNAFLEMFPTTETM